MTNSDFTEEDAKEAFSEMGDNFNLMMGAKTGKLETPISITTSFSGSLAEATGSARHVCDFIEEAGHGYEATEEHIEEVKPISSDGERYQFEISVTSK